MGSIVIFWQEARKRSLKNMLQVISRFIAGLITACTSFYIASSLLNKSCKRLLTKKIIIIFLLGLLSIYFYKIEYAISGTLITMIFIIYSFKFVYQIPITKAIIVTFLVLLVMILADITLTALVTLCYNINLETLRSMPALIIITNVLCALIAYIFININIFNKILKTVISESDKYSTAGAVVFAILEIITICLMATKIEKSFGLTKEFFPDAILLIIILFIFFVFIRGSIKYQTLAKEYRRLLDYVKYSEDWIETNRLQNHEMRNQLIVIKNIASKCKNKELNDYIDTLINESIENKEWIDKINRVPKEGLRGLLYYKIQQMEKEKINVSLDISKSINKNDFSNLSISEYQNLCTIVGVYLDNAIEAAIESENKYIGIELYKSKNKIITVISNTYKGPLDIEKFSMEGYSTKGKGRGYGLPLVKRILKNNNRLDQRQEIINDYYVQYLEIIKKL
jgi:two-component system sensor histidine kinase AgrC